MDYTTGSHAELKTQLGSHAELKTQLGSHAELKTTIAGVMLARLVDLLMIWQTMLV